MKKIYFLISLIFFGLISSFSITANHTKNLNHNLADFNIDGSKYLPLAYQNGHFFSWNHDDSTSEHYIGVFTNDNKQSYLLTNTGVFTSLNYEVLNLTRINNDLAIAQLSSYYDQQGILWTNKNFIVEIVNHDLVTTIDQVINTTNNKFAILNDQTFVAYGIGLDLISVSDNNIVVTNKIPAYQGGYYATDFYFLSPDSGILINGDQNYYYLKNISSVVSKVALNITALGNMTNNVAILTSTTIILRNNEGSVFYYDLSAMTAVALNLKSCVNNFAFILDSTNFIINASGENYTNDYGTPYLVKTSDLTKLQPIAGKNSLRKMVVLNHELINGIFIDGNGMAYYFQFVNDNFTFENVGSVDDYYFANQNLGFAIWNNTNLLLSYSSNQEWLLQKSINFTADNNQMKVNFLNNLDYSNDAEINHKNTYVANNVLNLNVVNKNLVSAMINKTTVTPINNTINYKFSNFADYDVTINFLIGNQEYALKYQVTIDNFQETKLLNILGSNIINYVGINDNQLYDIQAINENDVFTVTAFNHRILQNIQLIRYEVNLIVRSVNNIKENATISATIKDRHPLKNYLSSLRINDWLNQTRYYYLGFITNGGTKPMINFWDTPAGKNLRTEALARNYTAKQLDNMDAEQITNLINLAKTWKLIKVQATALAYIIIAVISISLIITVISTTYDWYLNKKIKISNLKKVEMI